MIRLDMQTKLAVEGAAEADGRTVSGWVLDVIRKALNGAPNV